MADQVISTITLPNGQVYKLAGTTMEEITYAALKTKRDNGTLTPGRQYRIIDYVCTTTQRNTRVASHPFDIIVVADDESTLNENARACKKSDDNYYNTVGPTRITVYDEQLIVGPSTDYDYFFTEIDVNISDNARAAALNVTYDGTDYIIPVDSNDFSGQSWGESDPNIGGPEFGPVFNNYPIHVNLNSWNSKIITPLGTAGTHTLKIEGVFTNSGKTSANLDAWELKYCLDNDTSRFGWADTTNGKGVIYYMKDDRGNECPYDFKQIQFKRYLITASEISNLVGQYTSSLIAYQEDIITEIDENNPVWAYTFSLNESSFTNNFNAEDASIFKMASMDGGVIVCDNVINPYYDIEDMEHLSGNQVYYLNNIAFINSSGSYCTENKFRLGCSNITFGDNCSGNDFLEYNGSIVFGYDCSYNVLDGCYSIIMGVDSQYNKFGYGCNDISLDFYCYNNYFEKYCDSISLGVYCNCNTFGNNSSNITVGDNCDNNTIGAYCQDSTLGDCCSYNVLGSNVVNVTITGGTSGAGASKMNYHVLNNVGNYDSPLTITGTNGNKFITNVGYNSSDTLVTWVPADLRSLVDGNNLSYGTVN